MRPRKLFPVIVGLLTALALVVLPYTVVVTTAPAAPKPLPWTHFSQQAHDAVNVASGACPQGEVFVAYLQTPAGERFVLVVETGDGENRWLIAEIKNEKPIYVWLGHQEQDTTSDPMGHDKIVAREGRPPNEAFDVCAVLYPEKA